MREGGGCLVIMHKVKHTLCSCFLEERKLWGGVICSQYLSCKETHLFMYFCFIECHQNVNCYVLDSI